MKYVAVYDYFDQHGTRHQRTIEKATFKGLISALTKCLEKDVLHDIAEIVYVGRVPAEYDFTKDGMVPSYL